MCDTQKWLLLSYRVPADPSTVRVRVWRTLKSLGALYIQQSVCILPHTTDTRKRIDQLRELVVENHGEALLLGVDQFSDMTEKQLIALFNEQREMEYKDFIGACNLFHEEIERETELKKFIFHEVEENEAELLRLKRWHRKVLKRDFFSSAYSTESAQRLNECETVLRRFTEQVYESEGEREGELT